MLDEEMDHIIREAANNHHPAYNDKAWEKMELQLDKHLPQKNDRGRLIFFLLFFLLLGGGILFTLNRFGNGKNIVVEKNNPGKRQQDISTTAYADQKIQGVKDIAQVSANTDDHSNKQIPDIPAHNNSIDTTGSKFMPQNEDRKNNDSYTNGFSNNNNELAINGKQKTVSKFKTKIKITAARPFEETQTVKESIDSRRPINGKSDGKTKVIIAMPVTENSENTSTASAEDKEVIAEENKISKEPVKNSIKSAATEKKLNEADKKSISSSDKKKKENKFKNNFGLTFSVGPGISFVKLSNTGKTTLTYGAGISYSFAKRFTARAGFYVSKKIYDASPDQYHNPGGNYPYLTDVEANCKVYEIPVGMSYSFAEHNKHKWFGSVALSSFIMKTEDYTYNYKNPAGQTYAYYQEVKNQNKHYFALLNLSGGYQYQLNKRVSMQAEPYIQIPLSGVGLGKIKLNSAGILFTLTLKPFAKRK
jgi:hypothetical protein